jgi:hypothetical protein
MKELVRYLLTNRMKFQDDWTAQGFGFLRLRVSDSMRLHVWDSRLRQPGVSDIHDHTQWAFTSHVMSGQIVNVRFQICEPTCDQAVAYHMATLKCGVGGGMLDSGPLKLVHMLAGKPELYQAGMSYRQEPDEIHRTLPADGTVTLIRQERRQVDTARVFWPEGGSWGDAIPRPATKDEVADVGGFALSIFDADLTAFRRAA